MNDLMEFTNENYNKTKYEDNLMLFAEMANRQAEIEKAKILAAKREARAVAKARRDFFELVIVAFTVMLVICVMACFC